MTLKAYPLKLLKHQVFCDSSNIKDVGFSSPPALTAHAGADTGALCRITASAACQVNIFVRRCFL